jgi:tetratricopeptide (TPR) repeat protein
VFFGVLSPWCLGAQEEASSPRFRFENSEYQEIHVAPAQRFSIELAGTSWYINRYDRDTLTFHLRKIGSGAIEFVLTADREATAYILFSSVKDDLYVRVFVREKQDQEKTVRENESDTLNQQQEKRAAVEVAPPEKKPPRGKAPPQRSQDEQPQSDTNDRKPVELFYTDDDGNLVKVPVRQEENVFEQGVSALQKDRLEEAELKFSEYLSSCERCSRRTDALVSLAEVFRRSGRNQDALNALTKALASTEEKEKENTHLKIAELYLEMGSPEMAASRYLKAYEISRNPDHLKKAGDLYFQHEKYLEAASAYEKWLRTGLEDPTLLYRLATVYDLPGTMRDIQKAYHYYRLLAGEYPDSPLADKARERVRFFEEHFYRYR